MRRLFYEMYQYAVYPNKTCQKCGKEMVMSIFGYYYCTKITCEFPKIYRKIDL
jgi:hypothetical protein